MLVDNFLPLGVGIGVSVLWEAAKGPFFGLFAKKPKIEIDHHLRLGPGNRSDGFDALEVEGIKTCGTAATTTLLDYDLDGYDDVITMCPDLSDPGSPKKTGLYLSRSNGDGTFELISEPILSVPAPGRFGTSIPVLFDIDGDGLQDVVSCADVGVLELRRRRPPPFAGFYDPLQLADFYFDDEGKPRFKAIPFCTAGVPTYNIFDVNGDGTPDLLARGPDGWATLRYSRSTNGEAAIAWHPVHFPDARGSDAGRGMSIADFNADGLPDVWQVDSRTPEDAIIWLNKGTGRFSPKTLYRPLVLGGYTHTRTAALDYNADGRIDLLEHWQDSDGVRRSVALLPSPGLHDLQQVYAEDLRRMITTPPFTTPSLKYGPWLLSGDIDGDGNPDIFGESVGVFYGSGARNTFLAKVTDGLGNVVTVSYHAPGASPTYSTDERCEGNVWPERCLKKMVGLVSSHKEGFISEGDTIFERSYTYRYRNGRMNVAGHGWLGFDERTVDMYSEGAGFASTTLEYEPPARYLPNGQPAPLPFTYLYPLAGLPKRVTTIQGSHLQTDPSPLEDRIWSRKTVVENKWIVEQSASGRPFPRLATRERSVFQLEVLEVGLDPDNQPEGEELLQTRCLDVFFGDDYGNVTRHNEACQFKGETPVTSVSVHTNFDPDPTTWLISNPTSRSIASGDFGANEHRVQAWSYTYDSSGLLSTIERKPGSSPIPSAAINQATKTALGRDGFGNVTQIIEELLPPFDPLPRSTTISFDVDGVYPLAITNAEGHTTEMRFDKRWGKPTSSADANKITHQQVYDGFGRLWQSNGPTDVTTYEYDWAPQSLIESTIGQAHPRVQVTVDRAGNDGSRQGTVVQEYDSYGRLVRNTAEGYANANAIELRAFDARGRLLGETLPHTSGASTIPTVRFTYDHLDRVTKVERSDGSFLEHHYARGVSLSPGNQHWITGVPCISHYPAHYCATDIRLSTDETGRQNVTVTDHRGRVIRTIDGENIATANRTSDYRYDGFDRLFEARDNGGNVTRFEHDSYGRLLRHTDPNAGVALYTYNGFDELIQSEDPSGQVRTFAYDELGRQVSVTDAAGVTQWIYDQGVNALGRLSETVAPPTPENPFGQREQYTYESGGRGLLARFDAIIDGEEYPVTFTYDDLGRPKRIHYPNVGGGAPVVVEHTYSTSGILTGLDEVGTGTSRQLWRMQQVFQGHLLARETFGNGASTTYGYDPDRHWIDSIETTFGGAQVQALEYSRNAGGLITARHATGRDLREYTYDALNRLQSTTTTPVGGAAEQVTYTYDTLGNITHTGQYAVGYHGTREHQVTTVGPNSYQYNTSGNVRERSGPDIPGGLQTIEYTPFDLPRTITSGDLVTHFEYTADETRVVRRDIDRTRHFVGDLYQRVISPTGDTLEERFRVQAGGRLIGEIVRADGAERTLYAHTDHQGTLDTLTAGPGEIYVQPYSPWGSPLGSAGLDETRAGYTGHQHDTDLGLIDMRGRIYDPLAARFMSPDPVMQAPYWSQGLNRYSYVFNNPVNNTDPTGFFTGNDAAAMYAPFHLPAMTTMGALGSGLGFATGPLSVGTTLLGGGAGFAQAGGTVNVAARQAAVGSGTGQGGTHATAQNRRPPPTQSQADDLTERLVQILASLPDERLAEVTARYSRKTGKLTVIDNDTGERLVLDVESGGKPTGDPIPAGEYEILEQRRTGQYRLDALDSSPRNDVHEPTGRTSFRLHGPGRTLGCIACKDPSSWRKVKLLIDRTSTSMVKDNATPWWRRIFGTKENIRKFGRLIVE